MDELNAALMPLIESGKIVGFGTVGELQGGVQIDQEGKHIHSFTPTDDTSSLLVDGKTVMTFAEFAVFIEERANALTSEEDTADEPADDSE